MIGNNSCGAFGRVRQDGRQRRGASKSFSTTARVFRLKGSMTRRKLGAAIARGGRRRRVTRGCANLAMLPPIRCARIFQTAAPRFGLQPRRADAGARLQPRARDCRLGGHAGHDFSRHHPSCAAPEELALAVLGFDDVFIAAIQMPWCWRIARKRSRASTRICRSSRGSSRCRACGFCRGRAFLLVGSAANRAMKPPRAERVIARRAHLRECTGTAYVAHAWGTGGGLADSRVRPGLERVHPGRPRSCPAPQIPPRRRRISARSLRGFDRILRSRCLKGATYYGHFGEGCVHARVNFDLTSAAGIATFRSAMVELGELVDEPPAVRCSGRAWRRAGALRVAADVCSSPTLIDAFRDFKRIFDPDSMMNPGRYRRCRIRSTRIWDEREPSAARSFANAFQLHCRRRARGCGAQVRFGIGKCRKIEAGTMCPSPCTTGTSCRRRSCGICRCRRI